MEINGDNDIKKIARELYWLTNPHKEKRNLTLSEKMIRVGNQKEVTNFVVELVNNKTVIIPASKVRIDNFQGLVLFFEQDEIVAMYKLYDVKGFFRENTMGEVY